MTDKLPEVHTKALKRFQDIENFERVQRRLAVEDLMFIHAEDGQWSEDIINKRRNRPRMTIDRIGPAIDQLVGDQRQNRTDIKVRPVSGNADADMANIFNGLIRNIEAQSKAQNAYDAAFDEKLTGGYGGWRVLTVINDDDIFTQDIKISPIESATTSLWFDSSAKEYDKRDANFAFLSSDLSTEEFKDRYPDAAVAEFDQTRLAKINCGSWFRNDVVRVAEYWLKVPTTREVGLLSDGRVIDLGEEKKVIDDLAAQGVTVLRTRKAKSHKVVRYIISGAEVLEGPQDWAGKFIPLVPDFGKTIVIEGRQYVRGLVRKAKDAQRIYNYATSAAIEATALTPKDPIWHTSKQKKGKAAAWRSFNTSNSPFMEYNSDPGAPGPPARTGAPALQTALIQQVQQAGTDIHATTGLEPASLGNVPELKSGKAIEAQQRMGDRGAFVFVDNHLKSIQYTGDILIDLIPKIYDTARVVRVLNIDGTSESQPINFPDLNAFGQSVTDKQTGEVILVNDITAGKYDVVVESGPAFNTQRQESAQQLIDLAAVSPVFQQVATDLIAKNLNILEGEELTKRIRRVMIGQGIVDPTEDETEELGLNQPQQPDPTQEALIDSVEAQTALTQADTMKRRADTLKATVDAQQVTVKALEILVDTIIKKINAGISVTPQELDLLTKQRDIVAEGQQALDPGPNSLAASEIAGMVVAETGGGS